MLDLNPYVNAIREQLLVAAQAGGDDARELAERLTAPLEAAVRLTLLDALEQAAAEITRELAPGSVQLRLRAGSPEFVVIGPAGAGESDPRGYGDLASAAMDAAMSWVSGAGSGEREMARLNLRLPEQLKARVDEVADRAGLSTNAWLVRVAAAAVESERPGTGSGELKRSRGTHTYKGWAR
ncbi:MAG TPA: ribbon-helix-helix protein, CopG family [Solirubrobacteraceae bacterium]|nr:ribbon-helix-helix protein, CopG family [Solirubrobacteraceae bacterium]